MGAHGRERRSPGKGNSQKAPKAKPQAQVQGPPPGKGKGPPPGKGKGSKPDKGKASPPDKDKGPPPDKDKGPPPDKGDSPPPDKGDSPPPDNGNGQPPAAPKAAPPSSPPSSPPPDSNSNPSVQPPNPQPIPPSQPSQPPPNLPDPSTVTDIGTEIPTPVLSQTSALESSATLAEDNSISSYNIMTPTSTGIPAGIGGGGDSTGASTSSPFIEPGKSQSPQPTSSSTPSYVAASSSQTNLAAILAPVFVILLILGLIIAWIILRRRRGRKVLPFPHRFRSEKGSPDIEEGSMREVDITFVMQSASGEGSEKKIVDNPFEPTPSNSSVKSYENYIGHGQRHASLSESISSSVYGQPQVDIQEDMHPSSPLFVRSDPIYPALSGKSDDQRASQTSNSESQVDSRDSRTQFELFQQLKSMRRAGNLTKPHSPPYAALSDSEENSLKSEDKVYIERPSSDATYPAYAY